MLEHLVKMLFIPSWSESNEDQKQDKDHNTVCSVYLHKTNTFTETHTAPFCHIGPLGIDVEGVTLLLM